MVNAVHVGLIERSESFPVARLGGPDDPFLVIFRFQILLHAVSLWPSPKSTNLLAGSSPT